MLCLRHTSFGMSLMIANKTFNTVAQLQMIGAAGEKVDAEEGSETGGENITDITEEPAEAGEEKLNVRSNVTSANNKQETDPGDIENIPLFVHVKSILVFMSKLFGLKPIISNYFYQREFYGYMKICKATCSNLQVSLCTKDCIHFQLILPARKEDLKLFVSF